MLLKTINYKEVKRMEHTRERLSTRLGFILLSAGCAIGLGNVWRFPYMTGQYGGAVFVFVYILFLIIFGLPIMVMEFAVGRASQKSVALSFNVLEPKNTKWHLFRYVAVLGSYLLMMFYTTVAGWTLIYMFKMAAGDFTGLNNQEIGRCFNNMVSSPLQCVGGMIVVVIIGLLVCCLGLQNSVEKITKIVMSLLFLLMIIVTIKSLTLPNAVEGIKFYLKPDFSTLTGPKFLSICSAAMSQAFFSLGLGVGSMGVFGSYIDKKRSLTGEAIHIISLDLLVGILSGLIIFPACASFGVRADSGPSLLFVTLPNVFNSMNMGRVWGTLFFIAMSFAALSTIIAVFENIVSIGIDMFNWTRKKSVAINAVILPIVSLPCALGYNIWKNIQPMGVGSTIQDLEDFILSSNIILFGAIVYVAFCTLKKGWGYENFIEEANCGEGIKLPKRARIYLTYILPLLILVVFAQSYVGQFFMGK